MILTGQKKQISDIKRPDYEISRALIEQNVQGRTQQIQNSKFSYEFNATGNYILPSDVVITGIMISGTISNGTGSNDLIAKIKGDVVGAIYLSTTTGNSSSISQTFYFPNWIIKKGEEISALIGTNLSHDESIIFIGYNI